MLHKLGIVEEELDETLFWFELLIEGGLIKIGNLAELMHETGEILAMTVASRKTLRAGVAAIENRKSKIENSK
jgi:four helix bundle protein